MKYRFDKERGVVDENNVQVFQLVKNNCSEKFRIMAGKLLAEAISNYNKNEEEFSND